MIGMELEWFTGISSGVSQESSNIMEISWTVDEWDMLMNFMWVWLWYNWQLGYKIQIIRCLRENIRLWEKMVFPLVNIQKKIMERPTIFRGHINYFYGSIFYQRLSWGFSKGIQQNRKFQWSIIVIKVCVCIYIYVYIYTYIYI